METKKQNSPTAKKKKNVKEKKKGKTKNEPEWEPIKMAELWKLTNLKGGQTTNLKENSSEKELIMQNADLDSGLETISQIENQNGAEKIYLKDRTDTSSMSRYGSDFDPSSLSENEVSEDDSENFKCYPITDTFKVSTIFESPLSLGYYRHISTGYRVHFTIKLSLKTALFKQHNETINIWSHFLGVLYFLYLLVATPFFDYYKKGSLGGKLVLLQYPVCAIFCLGSSTAFHTLKCVSGKMRSNLLKCDLVGIIVMIFGATVGPIYYGWREKPSWRIYLLGIYMAYSLVMGFCLIFVKAVTQRHKVRVSLLILFAFIGFLLITVAAFLLSTENFHYFIRSMGMYIIVGSGTFVYLLKIPEKFSTTNKYDIYGASHQWWHLFVLGGALWTHYYNVYYVQKYPSA
ncbi:adiponectin receptor protein [Anaeramoeba flamelloides]|uniref:Adiponectin receptor protein n=1 Tax=Anaeramoeba flamelloides TaxID=1746091 RepID=A0ABQ8ZCE9_9EUKA|nr:adiponectin receptor protein [Anaeramoeba flamelloides]